MVNPVQELTDSLQGFDTKPIYNPHKHIVSVKYGGKKIELLIESQSDGCELSSTYGPLAIRFSDYHNYDKQTQKLLRDNNIRVWGPTLIELADEKTKRLVDFRKIYNQYLAEDPRLGKTSLASFLDGQIRPMIEERLKLKADTPEKYCCFVSLRLEYSIDSRLGKSFHDFPTETIKTITARLNAMSGKLEHLYSSPSFLQVINKFKLQAEKLPKIDKKKKRQPSIEDLLNSLNNCKRSDNPKHPKRRKRTVPAAVQIFSDSSDTDSSDD